MEVKIFTFMLEKVLYNICNYYSSLLIESYFWHAKGQQQDLKVSVFKTSQCFVTKYS